MIGTDTLNKYVLGRAAQCYNALVSGFGSASTLAMTAMTIAVAPPASAEDAIEIGGRIAVTGNFSVFANNPGEGSSTTSVLIGGAVTRTTADARWDYGAGFFVVVGEKFSFVTPYGQIRINSDLMGPGEKLLFYFGFVAGFTFVDDDGPGDDELGALGPKIGAEYYISSRMALQLEDIFIVDTDAGVTNNLTLGIKFIF